METLGQIPLNRGPRDITVPGPIYLEGRNLKAANKPFQLTNEGTNKSEPVVLFDPQDEVNDYLLSSDFRIELKTDLKRALSSFSPLKQRIIVRVLLQGMSVREATKRMRCTKNNYEKWLRNSAIPQLRKALSAYAGELRSTIYSPTSTPPAQADPELHTAACKFCTEYSVTHPDKEYAFKKLKQHIKKEHPKQFAAVKNYVHAKDFEIRKLEMSMWETGKQVEERNED